MTAHRSSQEWSKIVTAYENRNVTLAQFCEGYDISPAALYYHRRKLAESDAPSLIELPSPAPAPCPADHSLDCHLEFEHRLLGRLKVSCGAIQLGQIVEQLSNSL